MLGVLTVLALALGAVGGCAREVAGPEDITVVRPSPTSGDSGGLQWGECVTEVDGLECGSLVGADRSKLDGKT